MKLKSLLLVASFSLLAHAYAANVHTHPKTDTTDKNAVAKGLTYPGYCQIEIINDSLYDIHVSGTFDDNAPLDFFAYRYDAPHYINMYYYGYCHSSMYLTLQAAQWPYQTFYSNWTSVDSTIRVGTFFNKEVTAEVSAR